MSASDQLTRTATWVCTHCTFSTVQHAACPEVGHVCKSNGNTETLMVKLEAGNPPVDLCCDGCDAERPGLTARAWTDRDAKAKAKVAGWVCDSTGDWCPTCVAKKGAS